MIKLRDLITEGKPRAGDYVKVVTGEVGQINKVKGKIAWIKLASNKKSFFPSDVILPSVIKSFNLIILFHLFIFSCNIFSYRIFSL